MNLNCREDENPWKVRYNVAFRYMFTIVDVNQRAFDMYIFRLVDLGSLKKFQLKVLHEAYKKEAYHQGHCFANGEVMWSIRKALADNMHALHKDMKANVGIILMLGFDLGGFVKGMYPDEVKGNGPLLEKVWRCKGERRYCSEQNMYIYLCIHMYICTCIHIHMYIYT